MSLLNSTPLEMLVWILVPALLLVFVAIVCNHKRLALHKSYYVSAALSAIAGVVLGPSCLCTEPLQKAIGVLLLSVPLNVFLFAATTVLLVVFHGNHHTTQAAQSKTHPSGRAI
jgi:hypothetical protein